MTEACPLCGVPAPAQGDRCPECAYPLAGVAGRRPVLTPAAWRWSLMGMVLTYVVTLGLVAITN